MNKAAQKAGKDAKGVELKADTTQIEKAFSRLGDLGRVVAGVAVVAALKHAIDTGNEWAATVNRIARTTGDSLEESSRLAFVFERIGLSAESVSGPLAILNRNIQQGAANLRQYFDAATVAQLRTSSFSQQLPILAAAYQKLAVGQERTTFLFNAFGRGGQDLDKLLKLQTSDLAALAAEAERFGLVLDEQNAKTFKEYIQNHRAAEQASKGLQVQVGQLTLPIFEAFDKAMISVLTTLTNLPAPVQTLVGLFAVGAIGIGKYAQSIQALVGLGQSAVGFITRLVAQRGLDAAATVAQTAATTTSIAAINAEIAAHRIATGVVLSHAEAEAILARSHAVGAGVSAASSAAIPVATAGGLALGTALAGAIVAALAGAAIGTAIQKTIIEPALDAADRAGARQAEIEAGNALRRAAIQRGGGDEEDFDQATQSLKELKEEGKLTAVAIEALGTAMAAVRIRRVVEEGGDLDAELRAIVEEANNGTEAFGELATTVADFVGIISQLQTESIQAKAAQAELNTALRVSGTDTAAGTQAMAEYAHKLFEAAEAAANAAGAEFDAAAGRRDAAAAAIKAGEDFVANQKRIDKAIEDGRERIADAEERLADTIEDAAKRNADAQEALAEAIEDRTKRIQDAEEAVADAIEDRQKRIQDAEEQLADVRVDSAERVKDAKERLAEADISSAEAITQAERRLTEARKARARAITDARFALEAALRTGDAEAEVQARRALQQAKSTKDVDDAERDVTEAKADRETQLNDLRQDLADAQKQRLKDLADAEENLAEVTEDANERIIDAEERRAEAIEEANERVVEAQERVVEAAEAGAKAIADAQDAVREANEDAIEAIDNLNDGLATSLYLLERMNEEAENFENQNYGDGPNATQGGVVSRAGRTDRMAGGPVLPGDWGWVGEAGPEMVKWGSPGTVVNNDDVVAALRQMTTAQTSGSRGDLNVTVAHQDPRILANELAFRFGWLVRS